MVKCMGKPANRLQCGRCSRLPVKIADEAGGAWLEWRGLSSPCKVALWVDVVAEFGDFDDGPRRKGE